MTFKKLVPSWANQFESSNKKLILQAVYITQCNDQIKEVVDSKLSNLAWFMGYHIFNKIVWPSLPFPLIQN